MKRARRSELARAAYIFAARWLDADLDTIDVDTMEDYGMTTEEFDVLVTMMRRIVRSLRARGSR